jgi:hypothetical protein
MDDNVMFSFLKVIRCALLARVLVLLPRGVFPVGARGVSPQEGPLVEHFFFHDGEAVEEQLAEVRVRDGVETLDALASELLDDVSQEEVDAGGGGEVFDGSEKLGGEGFVVGLAAPARLACVVGAQGGMVPSEKHAAAVSSGGHVFAGSRDWRLYA